MFLCEIRRNDKTHVRLFFFQFQGLGEFLCCGGVLSKHLVFYTGKVGVMSVWSGSIVGMATLGTREVQGSSPGLVEEC